MGKRPKPKWRKVTNGEFASCWFCRSNTHSSLSFSNFCEIWACRKCARSEGKLKRLRKYPKEESSKKDKENPLIKSGENSPGGASDE